MDAKEADKLAAVVREALDRWQDVIDAKFVAPKPTLAAYTALDAILEDRNYWEQRCKDAEDDVEFEHSQWMKTQDRLSEMEREDA